MTEAVKRQGFTTKAPRLGFVPGFDGIRGLLVMMIVCGHMVESKVESFAVIVDLFFVMSAFLIVTLLMQEHRQNDRIDMKKFYARRAVRLLPSVFAYMAVWLVIGVIAQLVGFHLETGRNLLAEVLKDCAAALTYVYHLVFPLGLAAVSPDDRIRPLGQFWSLSVEEQFYLLIAVTVLVCMRRNRMRALAVLSALLAVWIEFSRFRFDLGPWPGNHLDSGVWSRGLQLLWMQRPDGLLLGVALAVVNARLPTELPDRWRRPITTAATVSFGVYCFCLFWSSTAAHKFGFPYIYNAPERVRNHGDTVWCAITKADAEANHFAPCIDRLWFMRVGHTLAIWTCAPVILCLARYKDWFLNRFLGLSPLRYLGRLSYTLYVWHLLPIVLLDGALAGAGVPVRVLVMTTATFACALPVYYFIEQRALKVKLRFSSEKESLDLRTGKMVNVEAAIQEQQTERDERSKD